MKNHLKRFWTPEEIELLIRMYPHSRASDIAALIDRLDHQVHHKARKLGLKKSPEFNTSPLSGRLQKGDSRGASTRFTKGCVLHNKGKKQPSTGRTSDFHFKKGTVPFNTHEIGSEIVTDEGYRKVKVAKPNKWQFVHRRVWQQANGEIPAGHAVVFKDGNKLNCELSNLTLMTRKELMLCNTIHRYPDELKVTMRVLGKLKKEIEKHAQKQD